METPNLPSELLRYVPWGQRADPIWPATTFSLRRNVVPHLFPTKIKEANALLLLGQLSTALSSAPGLTNPRLLPSEELSSLEKEFLFEHFFKLEGFQSALKGQGFVIDDSSEVFAMINMEDHLQIHLTESSQNLEKGWQRLKDLETHLSNLLNFAFSEKFGFLTSDPTHCGTGFIMTALLHLPALIHKDKLLDAIAKQTDHDITFTSMQGSLDAFLGDVVILRNQYTLGVSEENIFHSLHSAALQFSLLEKTLRDHLRGDHDSEMKDHVSRAFGLLMHSYQLATEETLNALSLMKLGLDLGWIKGVTDLQLSVAFFQCRRGHLTTLYEASKPEDLARHRAELIHVNLKPMELTIGT